MQKIIVQPMPQFGIAPAHHSSACIIAMNIDAVLRNYQSAAFVNVQHYPPDWLRAVFQIPVLFIGAHPNHSTLADYAIIRRGRFLNPNAIIHNFQDSFRLIRTHPDGWTNAVQF